ncbi:hypothetical protein N7489_008481 [Penicillium chrysogenum]|uniref:uncharacterized protein n=1 Tax=Penicillium chrysogenum TaxID=5076 RepID=UPI0024DF290D|nr:uncharacterized protein N7489_008481 [Penicillium chrysogenum]KAJ5227773.1 hypothetical protein N7489_008481 [Penicillium chrysogenum]KAJ6167276.1 hypothetical protein N7497_000119 [Penicillium chrysogenum]
MLQYGLKKPTRRGRHSDSHGRSNDWPSVVLEVAFSESRDKLQSDITYWLRASGGDVKMVITLQINQYSLNITIEDWGTQGDNSVNHLYQTVQISRKGSEITTTGSCLVIEFEKLFLRPPHRTERTKYSDRRRGTAILSEESWHLQGM